MKFSNGCWLQKEGCACFSPAEVLFYKNRERSGDALCADKQDQPQRGDTLGRNQPHDRDYQHRMTEVLRVQTYHHMGVQKGGTVSLRSHLRQSGHLMAEDTEDKLVISSGYTASGSAERERSTHILPR